MAEKTKKAAAKPREVSKDTRKQDEVARLNKLLADVGKDRLSGVEKLIDNAAFMAVALEDLQVDINIKGCVSEYQNGENQWGTKKSPELEAYTNLMQRYLAAIKQLLDLLPAADETPKRDALLDFIGTQ